MSNSPVTPDATELPTLEILSAGGLTLTTVPVIQAGGHSYGLNKQGFQAYGVDTQGASGDGKNVVGARTIDVLIQDTTAQSAGARMYEVMEALRSAASFRMSGVSIALSGTGGITATQPLTGDRTGDVRATIEYLPLTMAATDTLGAPVLGPL